LVRICYRYFQGHLKSRRSTENHELSVYCDVAVFAWLLQFVQTRFDRNKPQLSHSNVMAVLISSNFLQMAELVPLCVEYIAQHLTSLLQQGADVASLSEPLLQSIAAVRCT
jgi:uncharacterized membrane protein YGL010W